MTGPSQELAHHAVVVQALSTGAPSDSGLSLFRINKIKLSDRPLSLTA
jgi:hypothetical protein